MMSPSTFVNIWTSQGSTIPEEHISSACNAKIKTSHSIGKINHMLCRRLILRFCLPVGMKNVKRGQWANPWSFVFGGFVCGLHTEYRIDLLLLPFCALKLLMRLKRAFTRKQKVCHHVLTLISFQSCMTLFLLWNTNIVLVIFVQVGFQIMITKAL